MIRIGSFQVRLTLLDLLAERLSVVCMLRVISFTNGLEVLEVLRAFRRETSMTLQSFGITMGGLGMTI